MALRQAMLLGRLVSDTVDAFDRDQIILHDVYDSVLAGLQPVIVAAAEGFRRGNWSGPSTCTLRR
jgi:hypothetical protein